LAHALSNSGYSPEALAAVRAAVRLCPDEPSLYVWLGYHLAAEASRGRDRAKGNKALAAFQRAVDLDPLNSYALIHLGKLQWWQGKKREAIETLKAAIAADPSDADAHIALWEYQGRAIWRCRGRLESFQGMMQTIEAMNNLPESKALNQHFEWINRIWLRIYIISSVGVGITALLLWNWWRKRK